MRTSRIYLDHNASAPLLAEARAALIDALDITGNPSSVHDEGRRARAIVENARQRLARLVGADPVHVVFTSGATEAAATVLTPHWRDGGAALDLRRLAVASTDHPCLRDGGRFAADAVTRLPVDRDGLVRLEALEAFLAEGSTGGRAMVAMTLANSETGVIQRADAISRLAGAANALLVLDATQALGRMSVDIETLGADALIVSGHKIGAAKGIGALVLRRAALRPTALLTGGAQETRQRAGTEAVPLIASLGAAAEIAGQRASADFDRLTTLRDGLEEAILLACPGATILACRAERLPNTLAVAFPAVKAETMQIGLDLDGFAVSAGSACSSGKVGPSHVVQAMCEGGLGIDPTYGAIRISFGYETSQEELELLAASLARILARRSSGDAKRAAA